MKKILIVFALLCLSVSPVFAADGVLTSGNVSDPGIEVRGDTATATAASPLIAKLSSSVRVAFAYNGTAYAIESGHDKGRKTYASASGDTKIYSHAKGSNGTFTAFISGSDVAQFDNAGWTEL